MKHLCFDCTLSFAAGFNVLYIPCDYFLFIPSLLLSLQMQISSGFLLIFFQLIKCLWGRRESEVWSVSFKHTLHAASNLILLFTVTSITNGSEKKADFILKKNRKKVFLKIHRKLGEKKGICYRQWGTEKNPQVILSFMLPNLLNSSHKPQPLCGLSKRAD